MRVKSVKPAVIVQVPMDPRLAKFLRQEALKAGLPRNEWIAKQLAELLGRPELGEVPRLKRGPRMAAI